MAATSTSVRTDPPDPGSPAGTVPRWVRWYVGVFLGAFVVCGLAGIEAWPLSGFRLFSHVRHERVESWQPVVVDGAGVAADFSFSRLPPRDRNFVLTMRTFPGLSEQGQSRVCRAWLASMRSNGIDAAEVRLYLVRRDLVPRSASRPAGRATRTLRFACSDHGVTAMEDSTA